MKHIFVAVLVDDRYPVYEAFPDKVAESWLLAHVHALEWMGIVLRGNCPRQLQDGDDETRITTPCCIKP